MVGGSGLDIVIELSPVHAMQYHVHGSGSVQLIYTPIRR
jgi:hypothetical protein